MPSRRLHESDILELLIAMGRDVVEDPQHELEYIMHICDR
jgi:hypothetical protein